ncbi:XRE family transcriptional regulator [Cupriavidus sp. NPDC089707]|uniref:XRE family transcriptional regulator n=1 Tax=Cupriavidus sp. NPDC089707 TaxID=3363963 RepID=UPI00380A5DC9
MPVDQAARGCGVSVGMQSKLENGKGVNLGQVLRVLDGLGLTMLAHAAKRGDEAAWEPHDD